MSNYIKTYRVQRTLVINSPTHFATEGEAQHYADDLNLTHTGSFAVVSDMWLNEGIKLEAYPPVSRKPRKKAVSRIVKTAGKRKVAA